jgi:hypothetical protein
VSAAGEDFEGFAAARWRDLEAVALLATLDPDAARAATAAALADLRSGWAEALEDGAPTAAVRRLLLARVPRGEAPSALAPVGEPVPDALLGALAAEAPLVRTALAAGVAWDAEPSVVASLVGRAGSGLPPAVEAARGRVLVAHRDALAADGLAAADHRLDDDLAGLLGTLVERQPPPPDPGDLAASGGGRVRRRVLLVGGGVLAAAAATGGVAVARGGPGRAPAPAPTGPAPVATLPAGAPQWASTRSWVPRGSLAGDPGVRALRARTLTRGAPLLFAGEVHGLRVVVAADDEAGVENGTGLRAWSGPAGAPPERLAEVRLAFAAIYDATDVAALGVPHPDGAVVLVLTRPSLREASFSPVVRPTPAGDVARDWTALELHDGVGSALLTRALGPATRLRCSSYDGPLPRPAAWDDTGTVDEAPVDAFLREVVGATGVPAEELSTRVVSSRLPRSAPLPDGVVPGSAVSSLVTTTTPGGGVVRTLFLSEALAGGTVGYTVGPNVVAADAVDSPVLHRLDSGTTTTATVLVALPAGGRSVQLTDKGAPVSKVVRVQDGAAVVTVEVVTDQWVYGIRVLGTDGSTTYDGETVTGRPLLDLWGGRA